MSVIVKSEIVHQIWNDNKKSMKKDDIAYIVNAFISIMSEEIKKGHKIKIEGLGTFSSYLRQAYIGRNINGNVEEIADTRYIKFKPSKKLKLAQDS